MSSAIKILTATAGQSDLIQNLLESRQKMAMPDVVQSVEKIMQQVREQGSGAVLEYTAAFDKVRLTSDALEVSPEGRRQAVSLLDSDLVEAMTQAARQIRSFHEKQMEQEQDLYLNQADGRRLALLRRPLQRVGLYVPGGAGGKTPLFSSVLMNAIPAKVAGVRELIMCTPPGEGGVINPAILYAAELAGVDRIFRVGGAQAIAALAYGAAPIPAVDKICGPGNIYVNTAKRMVYGQVDIDMFAGPSEILVIADAAAQAAHVACDLLSQAEHDPLASAILLTDSQELALNVQKEIELRLARAKRKSILEQSLRDYSAIVVVADLQKAVRISNQVAPEHLELCVADDKIDALLAEVEHAGAVFLGYYSPEPLGDYWAGANHVLPTSGSARFFSPLNTGDFIKKMSLIQYSEKALKEDGAKIMRLAEAEGLFCHASAIAARMGEPDV